jgi:hypothetical protein
MSIEASEAEAAAVAVSHTTRVSLADIEANIMVEFAFSGARACLAARYEDNIPEDVFDTLGLLTIHIIVLKNGFTIIGKSAPADAVNFNAELGRKFAREDAIRQIWPLMGYALREKLFLAATADD